MTPEIRIGQWVARPTTRGWVVGRLAKAGKLSRPTYWKRAEGALKAVCAAYETERGVVLPPEAIARLRATAEASGGELTLSEVEVGERVLDAMEATALRAHYLDLVRAHMVTLDTGYYPVTPDDARAYFESLDPPPTMSRNFLACVFRDGQWEACGTYRSKTPGSHGNRLNQYRLKCREES